MIDENNLVFREVQKFGLWICRLPLILVMVLTIGVAIYATRDMMQEQKPPPIFVLVLFGVVGIGVPIMVSLLIFLIRLETEVRGDGLYVRFFPIHIRFKKFAAEDLDDFYTRTYRPMREYGGWGIRFGKSGKAYNIKGDKGLQLIFKDGKRLLIGSQRSQELSEAVNSIM